MVEMKPARRSLGRRAVPLVASATLVAALFTWLPAQPSGVIAIAADVEPSGSPPPDPTPTPDPTPAPEPTPPDPTAPPEPDPTPDPPPSLEPSPSPTPEPSPSPTPTPTPTPTPLPPDVIGPDGGVVEAFGVTLHVPAGELVDPVRFTLDRVTVADPETGVTLFGFSVAAEDHAGGAPIHWFGARLLFSIDASGWDLTGVDPSQLEIVELTEGGWSTIGTGTTSSLIGSTDHGATFAVFGRLLPARVSLDQVSDAPAVGRHRVEPGGMLEVTVIARPATRLVSGTLIETIPSGWRVVDDDGGTFDPESSTVSWPLRSLVGGTIVRRTIRLWAPTVPYAGLLAVLSTFAVRVEQGSDRTDGPDLAVLVAPRVIVPHVTAGRIAGPGQAPSYRSPDEPLVDAPRFQVFRLRFDVRNADDQPIRWAPQLEFRETSDGAFRPLPAGDNVAGVAFYTAPEWTRQPGGGTAPVNGRATVDGRALGSGSVADADASEHSPVDGTRAMGLNPLPDLVLPPRSRTVVEFSVRATVDAAYLSGYEFRLTDLGEAFAGAAEALVVLEAPPVLDLSPGQRVGVPSGDRPDATVTSLRFALSGSGTASRTASQASTTPTTSGDDPGSLRFALILPSDAVLAAAVADPIHGPSYSLVTDACAACHRSHDAAGTLLTNAAAPQLGLCASCHDGVTATDVQAGYAAAPANDPADRAFYRHEPTAFSGHITDADDALAGQLNRHSECADCHNPHNATPTPGAVGAAGWTASGRVGGAASVTATFDSPSDPSYALRLTTELEYQLCLKCHSGYTELPSNDGLPPSRLTLDKGVELDPGNLSYHPVAAAGTNDTAAMAASLSGMSPFKQWSFTPDSTIRCVNCHADPAALGASAVPADASLPIHASANRGILLAPYRDRLLKGATDAYNPTDFALCYLCHAEAPFRDTTGNERIDTNFRYHGLHVSGDDLLDHGSPGTDIDTAGSGAGRATCAECHFRIHSTEYAVNGQAPGSRLVNFSPNVTAPTGGTITWRQKTETLPGTCAVKCHTQPHADDY